jgi:beta-galactosidase GanA
MMTEITKVLSKKNNNLLRRLPIMVIDQIKDTSYWEYQFYCKKCRKVWAYRTADQAGSAIKKKVLLKASRYSERKKAALVDIW